MALNDLIPITRMESILNGDEISPVTREEYFWQQAATSEVPKPTGVSDAGKVVTVNAAGSAYELDNVPEEIPAYTSADSGKVLTVSLTGSDPSVAPVWLNAVKVVNLTFQNVSGDEVVNRWECDTSIADMYDAISNGKTMMLRYANLTSTGTESNVQIYPLCGISGTINPMQITFAVNSIEMAEGQSYLAISGIQFSVVDGTDKYTRIGGYAQLLSD